MSSSVNVYDIGTLHLGSRQSEEPHWQPQLSDQGDDFVLHFLKVCRRSSDLLEEFVSIVSLYPLPEHLLVLDRARRENGSSVASSLCLAHGDILRIRALFCFHPCILSCQKVLYVFAKSSVYVQKPLIEVLSHSKVCISRCFQAAVTRRVFGGVEHFFKELVLSDTDGCFAFTWSNRQYIVCTSVNILSVGTSRRPGL